MPHVPNLCWKDSKDKKQIKLNTQNVLKWTKFNTVNCEFSTKKNFIDIQGLLIQLEGMKNMKGKDDVNLKMDIIQRCELQLFY